MLHIVGKRYSQYGSADMTEYRNSNRDNDLQQFEKFFFFGTTCALYRNIRKRETKMRNLIVLNTKAELIAFLNKTSMHTLVNSVAFASDLLEMVRENDNIVEINEDLGFVDDGGWIEIDEMGYVVKDFAIC